MVFSTAHDGPALVLGAGIGYSSPQVLPFVATLRAAGYRGCIALIVADDFEADGHTLLDTVDFVRVPRPSLKWQKALIRWAKLAAPRWSASLEAAAVVPQWAIEVVKKYHHPSLARYGHYLAYLRQSPAQWIALSDVRDVIFQGDPFSEIASEGLHYSVESDNYCLGTEEFNREWILQGYGPDVLTAVGARPVSCSGVTIGDRASVLKYVEAMVREIVQLTPRVAFRFGFDQAAHNVLLARMSGAIRCVPLPTLKSPVATINGLAAVDLRFNESGQLIRLDTSQAVSVVHQYDRHPSTRASAEDLVRRAMAAG